MPDEAWSVLVDRTATGHQCFPSRPGSQGREEPRAPRHRPLPRFAAGDDPLVDAEVQRLRELGATHVRTDDDGHDYYAVMHDPEGNEFCVG